MVIEQMNFVFLFSASSNLSSPINGNNNMNPMENNPDYTDYIKNISSKLTSLVDRLSTDNKNIPRIPLDNSIGNEDTEECFCIR